MYYQAFETIVVKEILRFSRIWPQTIVPATVTTALYFVIFGQLIGERIGLMDGLPYIDFIVPGLILMTVISNSYANVVSSFYSGKFQHHVEEILVSPVPSYIILLGYVTGGIARGLIVGIAVLLISMIFVDIRIEHPVAALLIVVATSAVFSAAGFINAVFANSFDDISIVPTFILTPLTYLGGIFYSISMLPSFWQEVSLFNPILYMINGFRYSLYGVSDIAFSHSLIIVGGFLVALLAVAQYLLVKGVGIKN